MHGEKAETLNLGFISSAGFKGVGQGGNCPGHLQPRGTHTSSSSTFFTRDIVSLVSTVYKHHYFEGRGGAVVACSPQDQDMVGSRATKYFSAPLITA